MASLCEYPAGLNGSAVQFERCCGLGDATSSTGTHHRPLPCPAVRKAAAARGRSCDSAAAAASDDDDDEQQQQQQRPPSRRVTRSRAGKSDGKYTNLSSDSRPCMIIMYGFVFSRPTPANFRGQLPPYFWTKLILWMLEFVRCRKCVSKISHTGALFLFLQARHDRSRMRRRSIYRRMP